MRRSKRRLKKRYRYGMSRCTSCRSSRRKRCGHRARRKRPMRPNRRRVGRIKNDSVWGNLRTKKQRRAALLNIANINEQFFAAFPKGV